MGEPGRLRAGSLPRLALTLLAVALFLEGPATGGQPPKIVKIGILTLAWGPWHPSTEGFRDGLKDLGYVEGRNLTFVVRAAQGDTARLPELAAELVRQQPDLLYCVASPAPQVCKKITSTIPIVFAEAGDPVKLGLVESLARPGGNVTGIGSLRGELSAKRLEIFKETVPSLRRVLATYDPREPEEQEALASARTAARHLGLTLLERPITAAPEMEAGLAALRGGGSDGILVVQYGGELNIPARSLEVATSNRLPTMYPHSFWTKFGALVSYGPDQYTLGRQAARLARKILTGTPPRELPAELPDRIELIVNLKTAKHLGLSVPQSMLFRADRVIE